LKADKTQLWVIKSVVITCQATPELTITRRRANIEGKRLEMLLERHYQSLIPYEYHQPQVHGGVAENMIY